MAKSPSSKQLRSQVIDRLVASNRQRKSLDNTMADIAKQAKGRLAAVEQSLRTLRADAHSNAEAGEKYKSLLIEKAKLLQAISRHLDNQSQPGQ